MPCFQFVHSSDGLRTYVADSPLLDQRGRFLFSAGQILSSLFGGRMRCHRKTATIYFRFRLVRGLQIEPRRIQIVVFAVRSPVLVLCCWVQHKTD